MKTMLWKLANFALAKGGWELRRRAVEPAAFTMRAILERARARGLQPATIIDIGAASGRWTRKALHYFPEARYLLIEPLEERVPVLQTLRTEHPNIEFVIAAAGAHEGTAGLSVAPNLDSSGLYGAAPGDHTREVKLVTLDQLARERELPPPYLIKLDTHGFELPILAGGTAVLEQTVLLISEVYNFKLSPSAVRFHEMIADLETRGFRCVDLADPMLRPSDRILWQLDLAFMPADAPEFSTLGYR